MPCTVTDLVHDRSANGKHAAQGRAPSPAAGAASGCGNALGPGFSAARPTSRNRGARVSCAAEPCGVVSRRCPAALGGPWPSPFDHALEAPSQQPSFGARRNHVLRVTGKNGASSHSGHWTGVFPYVRRQEQQVLKVQSQGCALGRERWNAPARCSASSGAAFKNPALYCSGVS